MARILAAKASLCVRIDAHTTWKDDATAEEKAAFGMARYELERKLAAMEGKPLKPRGVAIAPNGMAIHPKRFEINEVRTYNADADGVIGDEPPSSKMVKKQKKKSKEKRTGSNEKAFSPTTESGSGTNAGKVEWTSEKKYFFGTDQYVRSVKRHSTQARYRWTTSNFA